MFIGVVDVGKISEESINKVYEHAKKLSIKA